MTASGNPPQYITGTVCEAVKPSDRKWYLAYCTGQLPFVCKIPPVDYPTASIAAPSNANPQCPQGWTLGTGKCYKVRLISVK